VVRKLARSVVALVLVAAAVGTLGYRWAYGTWWQTPRHIAYCGRTYDAGNVRALSLAQIEKSESSSSLASGTVPDPIVAVGHVPPVVGRPMLAAAAPKATLREGETGAPCSMAIFLKTGSDAYTSYGLVGSP
jgi:hypothetical protein